jgi:hypothetical protein
MLIGIIDAGSADSTSQEGQDPFQLAPEMLGQTLLAGVKEGDQTHVEEAAARHSGVQPTKPHLFHAGHHV